MRFVDGMRAAEGRGSKLSDELRRTGGAFTRFGFFVRSTVRDVDRFINLRWLLVVGFVNVLGNAIAVLGANLLALAASATKAAFALGGALVAGIGQLIPVVALLQLAMRRLDAVMKAVDATEKARLTASEDAADRAKAQRDAEERLTDSRYNLLQANEAVLESEQALKDARRDVIDAERDHRRAIEELAEARRKATENIVDARLEEKEAALALEEAELAVLEAKERLRQEEDRSRLRDQNVDFARAEVRRAQEALKTVEKQGDQALISSATQSLNFAEQNLNAILNAAEERTDELEKRQIDVKQAEINREQARLREQRQRRESRQTREEGVEGSNEVIQARERVRNAERAVVDARRAVIQQTRALRDANHNVALALREVRDAHEAAADSANNQSSAQKALNEATKDLSAAEKAQVRAIDRLKQTYRREFGPITDIITDAFTRAIGKVEQIILDPSIQKAAKTLAQSIADVIDLFSEFSETTEFREALIFFTENAAENVPKIGEAFLDLFRILIRIGRAATPIFNELIDRVTDFIARIERGTRNQDRLEKFFDIAGEHLNAWIQLAIAIGNVFGAFLFNTAAAEQGRTLLSNITDLLNRWADWIRENPDLINEFFREMRIELETLSAIFAKFALLLFRVFTSDESAAFSRLVLEVLVPAIGTFIQLLGKLSQILIFIFEIPVVGELAKWAVQLAIIYGLFNRLFQITGILGREGFSRLFKSISDNNSALRRLSRAALSPVATFNQLKVALAEGTKTLIIFAAAAQTKLKLIGQAILAFSRTAALALLTPPVGFVVLIGAIVAALVVLELKFHVIERAVERLRGVFSSIADFFTKNWKTIVLAAILAPFSPFLAGATFLIRFRKSIIGAAEGVINFFRTNWKTIAGLLISPFGFATITVLKRFRGDITRVFEEIVDAITLDFSDLAKNVGKFLREIPEVFGELIRDAYNFGRDLVQGIIDGIKSKAIDLKDALFGAVDGAVGFVKDALGISSPSRHTYTTIGQPIGEGIKEGAVQGLSGMGAEVSTELRLQLSGLETEARGIRNRIINQLSGLQSAVSSQLGLKLEQLTPAERELERLDRQEAERSRQQQIDDASNVVKESQREVAKAQNEVRRAQKRFDNATTADKKRQARQELVDAKRNLDTAQKQLEDAIKRQAETQRQADLDRRRQRLQDLAREQREALEKSVAAEQNRADKMFKALRNALQNKNWTVVQNIFNKIVDLVGIKNLGKATADNFVDGLISGLRARQKDINKGFANQQKQAQEAARRERTATQVLGAVGEERAGTVAGLERQGLSDAEILNFLIRNDLLDKGTALSIARRLSEGLAKKSLSRILKAGIGIEQARFLDKLPGDKILSKPNLLAFLGRYGDTEKYLKAFSDALEELQVFQAGGTIPGLFGRAVPILAHAGEWVLNKSQQAKLAKRLGETVEDVSNFLFGTNLGQGVRPGGKTTGTRPAKGKNVITFRNFNLVPHEDPTSTDEEGNPVVIWFIEMDDGTFGQVSARDAQKIIKSNGTFIPGYVKRSTHGFTAPLQRQRLLPERLRKVRGGRGGPFEMGGIVGALSNMQMPSYNMGGIVQPVQSFAGGGIKLETPSAQASAAPRIGEFKQHFEVHAESELDWNYIMRLGALHAQTGY